MRRGGWIISRRHSPILWRISRVINTTIEMVVGAGFRRKLSHGANLIKNK
jgi:hypothetical protein